MCLFIPAQCCSNDRLGAQPVQRVAGLSPLSVLIKSKAKRLYRFGDVEVEHVGLLCDVERVTPQVSGSASKARS